MTTVSYIRSCLLSTLLLCYLFDSCFFKIDALVVGLGACRSDQIQALMDFKNEFDSRSCNHTLFVNGVRCNNATGAIKRLQLPSDCLHGTLKPNSSLFKLHHLRYLDLSNNNFTSSSLPSGFGNLNKLEVLYLISNGFVGQLPSSFSNLSQLSFLDLSHNELTGSLAQVGNLSKLFHLTLADNLFSEALDPSNSLHNLRHLNLIRNKFTSSSFLSRFENLHKLEVLALSSNGFQGEVPSSIGNLSQLSVLRLDNNKLTGSFPSVQNLTKLSDLWLSNNNFSGSIPPSLFTLPSLSHLDVHENHFSGPIEISNSSFSSSLVGLLLGNNHFDAQILEPISKLITLESLDLSFLNISYPIDLRLFSSLKSLQSFELSGNILSAKSSSSDFDIAPKLFQLMMNNCNISEFPKFLKSLQSLEHLDLSDNRMERKVPEWLWSLPRLNQVSLSNNSFNRFEGSAEMIRNSSVTMLDFSLNAFTGSLPVPPLSISLYAAWNNSFTGDIPLSFCNRSSLDILVLSYNNLSGSIPPCLSKVPAVNLRKNNLQGSLPDTFDSKSRLQLLDVGYNQISGELPRSLVNCSFLEFLSVEHNNVKDVFPFWLKVLPDLQVLTLRSNRFYGPISPPQGPLGFPNLRILEISDNSFTGSLSADYFVNWGTSSNKIYGDGQMYMGDYEHAHYQYFYTSDLQYKGLKMEHNRVLTFYSTIDLSGNRLEGRIPESIGVLKELIALNLSNNAFSGHIPSSLANVTKLESLDLSRNKLSGKIPQELRTISFLAYINVSHNQLMGEIPQGPQISGQPKSSFEGNAGLCGLPLKKTCFDTSAPATQHQKQEADEEEEEALNWKGVVIGYGLGVLLGLTIAQLIASYKRSGSSR